MTSQVRLEMISAEGATVGRSFLSGFSFLLGLMILRINSAMSNEGVSTGFKTSWSLIFGGFALDGLFFISFTNRRTSFKKALSVSIAGILPCCMVIHVLGLLPYEILASWLGSAFHE